MPLRRAGTVTKTEPVTTPALQRTTPQERRAALRPGNGALYAVNAEPTLRCVRGPDQGPRIKAGRDAVRFQLVLGSVLAAASLCASVARAQISDDVIRIGVLNDQSGLYADLGGPGSVVAARMAAEDAGGAVLGKPVEIVFADHQNKSDIGAALARQWFEIGKVDMAIGFDNSAVALAVEQLAAERNRIAIAGAVGSTAFTGKACTPTEASWIYDSYALTTSLAAGTDEAKAVMAKMREMPVNDFYVRGGRLREDGRLVHDMYFAQVKKPSESARPWDYYNMLAVIPGDQAFRALADAGCPLVAR
jgi:ABC-type branched-subunit amino acid transport system substrate-binding protein